jgi:hypothetical protein
MDTAIIIVVIIMLPPPHQNLQRQPPEPLRPVPPKAAPLQPLLRPAANLRQLPRLRRDDLTQRPSLENEGRPQCGTPFFLIAALIVDRLRAVAHGVNDTEKTEGGPAGSAQLMNFAGSDIENVEWPHLILLFADPGEPASPHTNHKMAVAMSFKAREAAGFELAIAHMELDRLAMLTDKNLA